MMNVLILLVKMVEHALTVKDASAVPVLAITWEAGAKVSMNPKIHSQIYIYIYGMA